MSADLEQELQPAETRAPWIAAQRERLLAQRDLQLQQPAMRADAAAGVLALGASTDEAVTVLVRWLSETR